MKLKLLFYLACYFFILNTIPAQVNLTYNGWIDTEVTKAGEHSHFYYNGIHKNEQDWRLKISQLNALFKVSFSKKISLHTRFLLERTLDQKLDKFTIANLHLKWKLNKKLSTKIGRFNIPYGQFSGQQHPEKRIFANLPAFYSYYVNVSDKIGYLEGMGEANKIKVDSTVQWGSSSIYYSGYTTGVLFDWEIKKDKLKWEFGITNGALNLKPNIQDFSNIGAVTKLTFQPTYFWKQGVSLAYGSFLRDNELYNNLAKQAQFNQFLLGTNYEVGFSFFEVSGEINTAFYKVAQFLPNENAFLTNAENEPNLQTISSFSSYTDVKYEPPFLSGFYLAYRLDLLYFNKFTDFEGRSVSWDNNVTQHSIGVGYKITEWMLFRSAYSFGNVKTKSWDTSVFRAVLTLHL